MYLLYFFFSFFFLLVETMLTMGVYVIIRYFFYCSSN